MNTSPDPKIALVTGASRGLGAALAEALAPTHHIIALARTTGALEELDDRIRAAGGQATLAPMDLTVEAAMQQLCRSIYDRWGRLDLFVHAAIHAAPLAPAAHVDGRDWAKSVEINATGTQRLITMVDPLLQATPDSAAVFFEDAQASGKFYGAYGATKAAQLSLARAWQAENARSGLRVSIVTPNPMPTATRARFHPGEDR
ncbi:SDR family NAD(P)-dependent oxidoreductase, partial [Brevirhabdus pacifica]